MAFRIDKGILCSSDICRNKRGMVRGISCRRTCGSSKSLRHENNEPRGQCSAVLHYDVAATGGDISGAGAAMSISYQFRRQSPLYNNAARHRACITPNKKYIAPIFSWHLNKTRISCRIACGSMAADSEYRLHLRLDVNKCHRRLCAVLRSLRKQYLTSVCNGSLRNLHHAG